jgi:hypothetical protein
VLETRRTLFVPCTLEATAAVLEISVETAITTDEDADGEEEAGSCVEDPTTVAVVELARPTTDEVVAIGLEELVGTTREELSGMIEEELGATTRADELGGLLIELLAMEVERTGATRVVVVVGVLVDVVVGELVLVAVVVAEFGVIGVAVVVVEIVIEVADVAVVAELLVNDDVVLVAVS